MKTILSYETTDIPDGVKIKVHAKIIEIKGSCGELIRNFKLLLQIMELSNSIRECCVKVALHTRPVIGNERLQGCKECVDVELRKSHVL